ncbi:MAG: PilT/PilU family type 4a pilus ATPase [Planctomycetaceae bacterium]|jgi:twitching motility protein PilT|nr:PilT/PilU family type 4a pilus ATPase [Planctomycetaceae bacterium]
MSGEAYKLLQQLVTENGSDLHLAADNPPMIRIHGKLIPLKNHSVLTADETFSVISQLVNQPALAELQKTGELDAAFELEGGYRIRINAYRQQGTYAAALRLLPNRFFEFKELGLPMNVLEHICQLHMGLILVTGATSSGKSTTIASIVNRINKERACHIHTIEDPVEYRHYSHKSFVTQREIGSDTATFAEALRRSMREDPDVIVVGEMRDLETMSAALTLSETGHLTFATLHTSTAIQTISRIVSAFPAAQQAQIRVQLASTLQYVICQKLVPWDNGEGRSLVAEILIVNSAVRAMIREEKTHQISNVMQTNYDLGMRTLAQSLEDVVRQKRISAKTAQLYLE